MPGRSSCSPIITARPCPTSARPSPPLWALCCCSRSGSLRARSGSRVSLNPPQRFRLSGFGRAPGVGTISCWRYSCSSGACRSSRRSSTASAAASPPRASRGPCLTAWSAAPCPSCPPKPPMPHSSNSAGSPRRNRHPAVRLLRRAFMPKYSFGKAVACFFSTIYQLRFPVLTIATILGLAFLMNYSGMSTTLGIGFTKTGSLFPFFAFNHYIIAVMFLLPLHYLNIFL